MPIAVKCPGCKAQFRLADELAGKKMRCQKCGQLFAAPAAKPAVEAPPPPIDDPPAAPPISLSLDDALPASAAPAPARVVPSEPAVMEAILAPPPPTNSEEILDAIVVDQAPPPQPPSSSRRSPPPLDSRPEREEARPARHRRAGDLPRHSNAGAAALAVLMIGFAAVVIVAGFVGLWFMLDLGHAGNRAVLPAGPPPQIMPPNNGIIKGGPGNNPFIPKLPLDANGRASHIANVAPGGDCTHGVFLLQNQRYNLLVASGFSPRVMVHDDTGQIIAQREGETNNLLTFVPTRTGEHTIHVLDTLFLGGNVTITFTPADNPPPAPIVLGANPHFHTEGVLRVQDPVSERFAYGPSHVYSLNVKPGEKYKFVVAPIDFRPVLRLQNGAAMLHEMAAGPVGNLEYTYTVPPGIGALTVHVVSQGNLLGRYRLDVDRLSQEEKPGPRTVVFDGGSAYHRDENLGPGDPVEGELGRAKTYLIPMEKGRGYNIDMKSMQLSPRLSFFDPNGQLIIQDEHSGGESNARILFDPKESGQYRLVVSDVKKETGAFSIDIAQVPLPTSMAVNQPLPTAKRQEAGCDITETSLPRGMSRAFTFAWAPGGKAFFMLDRDGVLHRIRYPDFVEDRRVQFAAEQVQIHATAAGLLVAPFASRELLLFDPDDLQLKRRLPRMGGTGILAAPELSYVFVSATFSKKEGGQAPGLVRHELLAPNMISFPFNKLPTTTQFLALSADGKTMVGRKDDHLMTWQVEDKRLVGTQAGTRYFRTWTNQNPPLIISKDGKLVLHPINNKLAPPDDIKPGPDSGYGIAAYRPGDFKEPAFVLDTGYVGSAAAIDPKTGLVCAFTKGKGFVLVDETGKTVRALQISTRGTKINQAVTRMEFHPHDGKLLAFFGSIAAPKAMLIEMPRE